MIQKIFGLLFILAMFWTSPICAEVNWQDSQWLKLLHYQKQWSGNYVSQADGKAFFLAVDGKISPKNELASFLVSLEQEEPDAAKNSFCRFPARVRWLKKVGHALPKQNTKCRDLEEFRNQVSARSIYIVFSTYFLSNPVSSFGHTFMRLGKTTMPSSTHELMDTGVSYSAEPGSAGFISYALNGLTGGFPGEFRAIPYYSKVHEYNNSEMRDLWSYQIDFSQEEIDFVVDHLWELGQSHFDYYFMSENCSYHMLTLLEAARPKLKLVERLPGLYVIPADTLRVIEKEGIIKSVSFRPSLERVSIHLRDSLSKDEVEIIPRVIERPARAKNFENHRAAALLDAALVKLELDKEKELISQDPEATRLQRELMLTRAKIPVRSPRPSYDYLLANAPHLGHASRRLKMASLNRDHKTWMMLGIRGAQHDILDNESSYLPKTSLEILEFVGRSDGSLFQVEEYTLVNIINLREVTETKNSLSWKARAGGSRDYFRGSERAKHGFTTGVGFSKTFKALTGYLLSNIEAAYVSSPETEVYASFGLDLGFLLNVSPGLRVHSMYGVRDQRWNESFLQNEIRISNLRHGIGAKSSYYSRSQQHEFQLTGFIFF